jgi:hypothetical protein
MNDALMPPYTVSLGLLRRCMTRRWVGTADRTYISFGLRRTLHCSISSAISLSFNPTGRISMRFNLMVTSSGTPPVELTPASGVAQEPGLRSVFIPQARLERAITQLTVRFTWGRQQYGSQPDAIDKRQESLAG